MGHIITRTFGTLAMLGATLAASSAFAAADYFLEIKGTKGERETIRVESFSWGATNSGSSAVRREATPPAHHGVLQVVTAREAGSGMASGRACAAGRRLPQVTLRGPGGSWDLQGAEITGCPAQGMTLTYAHATVKATKSRSNIQNN